MKANALKHKGIMNRKILSGLHPISILPSGAMVTLQYTKKQLFYSFATITALLLVACSTTYSDKDRAPLASKSGIRVQEKKMRFKATVVKHTDHGTYYTFLSTTGGEYYPTNLAFPYRENGIHVQVYGETEGYALDGSMRALRIIDISSN